MIPSSIISLMRALELNGFEALIVGGAVRDMLLNRPCHDYDLATNATPDQIQKVFPEAFLSNSKGAFPVMLLNVTGFDEAIQIASYRSDIGGRGDSFSYAETFKEDAKRRDFTCNALGMNSEGEILDYVGGVQDIQNRVLRFVGDPFQRIAEDPIRLIRFVRFCAKLDFKPSESSRAAVMSAKGFAMANERIGLELQKILLDPNPGRSFELLQELALLEQLLPEVSALESVEQSPEYHSEGNVLKHTCLCLQNLPKPVSADLAWSVLLHDVGKIGGSYGHDVLGSEMAKAILHRLGVSNSSSICSAISLHMVVRGLTGMRKSKQLAILNNECFPMLLELLRCDSLGSIGIDGNPVLKGLPEVEDMWNFHKNQPLTFRSPCIKRDLGIDGHLLMSLGLRGRAIADCRNKLQEAYCDNTILSRDDLLSMV